MHRLANFKSIVSVMLIMQITRIYSQLVIDSSTCKRDVYKLLPLSECTNRHPANLITADCTITDELTDQISHNVNIKISSLKPTYQHKRHMPNHIRIYLLHFSLAAVKPVKFLSVSYYPKKQSKNQLQDLFPCTP